MADTLKFDDDYYKNCPWNAEDDKRLIREVALAAGAMALKYFHRANLKKWEKSANNPVSEADVAVDAYLKDTLTKNRPGYGWLSEETEDASARLCCTRVWIVDPIDGTYGFINNRDDWCISVALIENGLPILSCIYAPLRDELYLAERGGGATLNDEKIAVSNCCKIEDAHMMGDPNAFHSSALWPKPWPEDMDITQDNSIALRIAQVASGKADTCVTLKPKSDWDMAAADLILKEAGGMLTTGEGKTLHYNEATPSHEHIVAYCPALKDAVMDRVTPALSLWTNK